MTPLALLKKRYLSHTDRVRYRHGLQGQCIGNDGAIVIGNRAGPEHHISNLAHELSHFVEVDDARMGLYGWGLKVPEVWVYDRMCCEPRTMQMTERELRVIAFQVTLLESLGAPKRIKSFTKSLVYMSDFIHVPLEDGRSAYGDGAPTFEEMGPREKDESRIRWLTRRVGEMLPEYTLERFDREWTRKINILSV